jgi:acetyltransferase-like isoleucine patch superfamily enzyme
MYKIKMKIIGKTIKGYLKLFHQLNIRKTIYFNFRVFSFSDAIKLPVYFFGPVRFINLTGSVKINSEYRRGMIRIGTTSMETLFYTREYTSFYNSGKIIFDGSANICMSCQIAVYDNGILQIGDKVKVGHLSRIICFESVVIKEGTRIAWETQIYDTNFHYSKSMDTGEIIPKNQPIILGKYNWIGNRVSIAKGTVTPDYCTIASNSLCNKDYSNLNNYPIIAGMPAREVKSGIKRLDLQEEHELLIKKGEIRRH